MPLFHFDIQDGIQNYGDEEGLEKTDAEEARKDLVSTLAQMAKDRFLDGPVHEIRGALKDANGEVLFKASLSFHSGWVK